MICNNKKNLHSFPLIEKQNQNKTKQSNNNIPASTSRLQQANFIRPLNSFSFLLVCLGYGSHNFYGRLKS